MKGVQIPIVLNDTAALKWNFEYSALARLAAGT